MPLLSFISTISGKKPDTVNIKQIQDYLTNTQHYTPPEKLISSNLIVKDVSDLVIGNIYLINTDTVSIYEGINNNNYTFKKYVILKKKMKKPQTGPALR